MKNTFLNLTKVGLFFSKTIIIIIGFFFWKNEINSGLFLIISICILLIIMPYMYLIYKPYSHISLKSETPMENIIFYLNVEK